LDPMDFGRRMTVERELETTEAPPSNVIFDESGNFILYATMIGIKIVNIVTNKVCRVLGKIENNNRFLSISLYQGKIKGSATSDNLRRDADYDPTLFCIAFKKDRFFLFSRREPSEPEGDDLSTGRDVFNERPKKTRTNKFRF